MSARPPVIRTFAVSFALLAAGPVHAELLFGRVVPNPPAVQPNSHSAEVDLSADGKTLVFTTSATNWTAGATDTNQKIIAVDADTSIIDHVSRTTAGAAISGIEPSASRDGRYVAFRNNGGALDVGVPTSGWQVVRKDRETGQLRLVSSSAGGVAADREARDPAISGDGRYVVFASAATNLGASSPGGFQQIYVKDVDTGAIEAASQTTGGTLPDVTNLLTPHALSGDGRLAVFSNNAANMVAGFTNNSGSSQVYARNLVADTTELVSVSSLGVAGDRGSDFAAISPSGRFVSFRSFAFNLGGNVNTNSGVYIRDRVAGTTTALARPTVSGALANSCRESAVSDVGTALVTCFFPTPVKDQVLLFVPGAAGSPFLVSSNATDTPGNEASGASVAVDASGLSMAFESLASNLVDGDTNASSDLFVLVDESVLFGIFSDGFED